MFFNNFVTKANFAGLPYEVFYHGEAGRNSFLENVAQAAIAADYLNGDGEGQE